MGRENGNQNKLITQTTREHGYTQKLITLNTKKTNLFTLMIHSVESDLIYGKLSLVPSSITYSSLMILKQLKHKEKNYGKPPQKLKKKRRRPMKKPRTQNQKMMRMMKNSTTKMKMTKKMQMNLTMNCKLMQKRMGFNVTSDIS